jgi:hypothetical protein
VDKFYGGELLKLWDLEIAEGIFEQRDITVC